MVMKVVSQNRVLVAELEVWEKKDEVWDDSDGRGPFPTVVDSPETNTHIHALIIDNLTCLKVEKLSWIENPN